MGWVLVMDYCPNGDLQKFLGNNGSPALKPSVAARLLGEIILGVEHLHAIRVIFRDLKLENVVLDKDDHAMITDFGLAKKLYDPADARTMCGSYGYAAPEIMSNTGKYTYAVDMYSYGVMMYLLISGGDPAQNNSRLRMPPMRHSALKRKLREAEKGQLKWMLDCRSGFEMVLQLTNEDPEKRGTSPAAKSHKFFTEFLGKPVEALIADKEGP